MTALIPLVFMLIGGLLYGLTNGKVSEVGRILLAAEAFALCFALAGETVTLLRG